MIYRVSKTENFVQIHKTLLFDHRISWKAKGILAHMLSRPDGWTFYETEMMNHARDGRDALRSGIQELMENGYLVKNKVRGEDGKFTCTEIIVHEIPQNVVLDDVPSTDGFSVAGSSVAGFPDTSKNEGSKIESSNKSSTSGFDLLLEASDTGAVSFEEDYARIRSEPSVRGIENAARDALKSGAPLPVVNSMLAKRIPAGYEQFSSTPRFAMKLHSYESSKAAEDFKLATLWKALAEDVGGVDYSEQSKTFSELRGAYKKILLSKYSYDQCIWTLRRAVKNTSNLSFLSKGGRNLVTLVQQNSKEYHDLRTEAKKLEAMERAQEERRASREEQTPKESAPPVEVSLKDNPLMLSLFQNAKNKGK